MLSLQSSVRPTHASAAISSSESTPKTTPHILPCRISHTGAVTAAPRYWHVESAPATSSGPVPATVETPTEKVAYLRGRKLFGREVELPDGYRGVIARTTDEVKPVPATQAPAQDENDEDDEELQEPIKIVQEIGAFDKIMVWGHEIKPGVEDEFVRGVEEKEWIGFAEGMHSFER